MARRKQQPSSPKVRQQIRELNERLKEQFNQDRRERFFQFRDWLKEKFHGAIETFKFSGQFSDYNYFTLLATLTIFANIAYYCLLFYFAGFIANKFGFTAVISLFFVICFPWKDLINLLQSLTQKK